MKCRYVNWLNLIQEWVSVVGCCGSSYDILDAIKGGELTHLDGFTLPNAVVPLSG
jgi:hypothetical protein